MPIKTFKHYLIEMYPFPVAPESQQVEKMAVIPPVPNMGGNYEDYKAKVKFEVPETKPTTGDYDLERMAKTLSSYESAGNEKKILRVYKDNKGFPTIGHGHLITDDSAKIMGDVFAEEQKQNPSFISNVLAGKQAITPEQANRLLQRDIRTRIPQIEKMLPNFKTYSPELQTELMSEHFRGMLGKSPNTLKLINQGNFNAAASAFLDADEYRNSKLNNTGIYKRMDNLSNQLKMEFQRQSQRKRSSQ